MNDIQIFRNEQFGNIRVAGTSEDPLFCLADICKSLDIKNISDCKTRLNQDGVGTNEVIDSLGRKQMAVFITESNLYRCVFQSRRPDAEKFQDWICVDVLPSIRKHGAYMTNQTIEKAITDPDFIIKIATQLKEERAEKERLALQNKEQAKQLTISAPKVEYCDKVLSSKGLLTVNSIAASLGMSAVRLNKLLCDHGIQYKQGDTYYLYSKYRNMGYTEHKPFPYTDSLGMIKTRQSMYWTEIGKEFILKAYNSKLTELANNRR